MKAWLPASRSSPGTLGSVRSAQAAWGAHRRTKWRKPGCPLATGTRMRIDDHHVPRSRRRPDRARALGPARPQATGRAEDHGLHARGRRAGRGGAAISRLPPGRPRHRGHATDEPTVRLDETGHRGLPGPAPRSARDGSIDAGRPRDPRSNPAGPGRLPDALPGRLDRPRCGAHPPGARRRSLERPRSELRRLHDDDLPVVRARGPARGAHHGGPVAGRAPARRRVRGDVGPAHREEPRVLRALP